jgi:hypothetical protein
MLSMCNGVPRCQLAEAHNGMQHHLCPVSWLDFFGVRTLVLSLVKI